MGPIQTAIEYVVVTALQHLTITFLLGVAVLYGIQQLTNARKNAGRHLRGPRGWPIVGLLPRFGSDTDGLFHDLGQQYGSVYKIPLGVVDFVVLQDYAAIREAMTVKHADNFAGRQQTFNLIKYVMQDKGIVVEDGEGWKEQRRFTLGALRDLGFGNTSMEASIHKECQNVVDFLESHKGQPVNPNSALCNAVSNVICSLTFGQNYEYTDPTFIRARDYTWKFERILTNPYLTFYPFLRFLPRWLTGIDKMDAVMKELLSFVGDIVSQHQKTFDDKRLRDYLDLTLQAMDERRQKNPNDMGTFDIAHLKINLFTFFFAGMTTTVRTVEWGLRFLSVHPEVQAEVQRELDQVIGERVPSWADRVRMPKTEAFIYETQRCADVVPLSLPHTNLTDVNVLGCDIPKRSLIITNLRGVHQDPKLWKDPQNFRPDRFIDANGKVNKPDYLMPFGVGKRICLGESLARMELFLFFATMVQRFNFLPASNNDVNNHLFEIEPSPVQRALKPFKIRAQHRTK